MAGMGKAFKGLRSIGYGMALAMGNLWMPSNVMAEALTVAALGDSLTAGYGLPVEDGLVPNLEAWLEEAGLDVDVINAGVSGDTTAGGLSRVGWTLTPDVDGMIIALGGNDFLRGIDPANSRENLRGILEAAKEAEVEVFLVGILSTANFGADFQSEFNGMYVDLAAEFEVPLERNFFAGLIDGGTPVQILERYMQADGIHPNAQGVDAIVADLGPQVAQWLAQFE
jgi:acyl-CoA thioesterase-1